MDDIKKKPKKLKQPNKLKMKNTEIPSLGSIKQTFISSIEKNLLNSYMSDLSKVTVLKPVYKKRADNNIVLLRIGRISYEKGLSHLDQFETVINIMASQNDRCNFALIIDSTNHGVKLYLAVRAQETSNCTSKQLARNLKDSIRGNFPGVDVRLITDDAEEMVLEERIQEAETISIYSSVPGSRKEREWSDDQSFVQGIERFIDSMQGYQYTAIFLAQRATLEDTEKRLYLCQMAKDSLLPLKEVKISKRFGQSELESTEDKKSELNSNIERKVQGEVFGINQEDRQYKPIIDERLEALEDMNCAFRICLKSFSDDEEIHNLGQDYIDYEQRQIDKEKRRAVQNSIFTSRYASESNSHSSEEYHQATKSCEQNREDTVTKTVEIDNIYIKTDIKINQLLELIDEQTERLFQSKIGGLWSTACYFITKDGGLAVTENAMKKLHGILQGKETGVETVAMNSFQINDSNNNNTFENIRQSLSLLCHPICSTLRGTFLPAVYLNSKELSRLLSFPRKSVCGLSVVPAISLATQVDKFDLMGSQEEGDVIKLGCIYNYRPITSSDVKICIPTLTRHLFVTGSTGSGKSNSVKLLLVNAHKAVNNLHTLIIEPSSKSEYKNAFPNWKVYGTSWKSKTPLEINPFLYDDRFVTLESHVNNLKALFVSCWDMSAAMPEILEQAMYRAYEKTGRVPGKNPIYPTLYPTMPDLIETLSETINEYDFHAEVKSNYVGALTARVKSLTVGSYRHVFSGYDIGNERLFEQNAIIDMTDLGFEEKALMMGLIVLRLNEYLRSKGLSSTLRHMTVIEEAHHLFGVDTQESAFGHNIQKVQREAFANLLAEVRAYGEGVIIVDQSPSKMDLSVIRNTNTKIVHRLPEAGDCAKAGHSINLPEDKLDILSRLPNGHAVIYQEGWLSPVVCAIEEFKPEESQKPVEGREPTKEERRVKLLLDVTNFLLCRQEGRAIAPKTLSDSCDNIKKNINDLAGYSTSLKEVLLRAIKDFEETHWTNLWYDKQQLLNLITPLIMERIDVADYLLFDNSTNYDFAKPLDRIWNQRFGNEFEKHKKAINEAILYCYSQSSNDRKNRVQIRLDKIIC